MIREQEGEESGAVYFRVPLSGSAFRRRHSRQHVEGILDGNINSIYRAPAAQQAKTLDAHKICGAIWGWRWGEGRGWCFIKRVEIAGSLEWGRPPYFLDFFCVFGRRVRLPHPV